MSTNSQRTAIVIGSGIGGLATAALLAKDGYQVTVIEKNEQPGGRASQFKSEGFTFDMGPSWYLMPDVFERFFRQFGASTSDYLELIRLKPHYRIFFADKTHLDITGDKETDKATFESLEAGAADKLDAYLAASQEKYETSMKHFLYRNMDTFFDFVTKELLTRGRQLGVFESMDKYVRRFFKHEKLQQIIQYTLVFLGGSPKNTPALYSLMSHIDFNLGVWYPKGGMYQISMAMVRIGQELGVRYIYNSPVTELQVGLDVTGQKFIKQVVAGGKIYQADVIISNADYAYTESILSDPQAAVYGTKYWQKKTLAPSAFLLYLGIKGKLPELTHHNLYFGNNWTTHFEDIFDKPEWPRTPSIYLNKTSEIDSKSAPVDSESLFVLVPVAAGLSETEASKEKYAAYIVDYLEKNMKLELKKRITFQKIFSVSDFADRYNSLGGSALGLAHTLFQTAIWRPSNHSRKVKNLFFVGGSTVPGIGVPICLISAELVRQRVHAKGGT